MSTAGARSNRGDAYQTYIAIDWAIHVISDPEFQWLEIDSTQYEVDDIVIGKRNGSVICCQCKKNQIDHKSWKISDLQDEIEKASKLLTNNEMAEVRFYSRSPFGEIAKLCEHCKTQSNEKIYQSSLGQRLKKIDSQLRELINPKLSTYDFLNRSTFESTPEFDKLELESKERLRLLVTNNEIAYSLLWERLDKLGAKINTHDNTSIHSNHRLTKKELIELFEKSGCIRAKNFDIEEIRSELGSLSSIGRSWKRDIEGKTIKLTALEELIFNIKDKKKKILLTGGPGSGKTCVLLELQDTLEQRKDMISIFIQSREFAYSDSIADREALGLKNDWVEKVSRLAEQYYVVVLIDSLDVLSICRDYESYNQAVDFLLI